MYKKYLKYKKKYLQLKNLIAGMKTPKRKKRKIESIYLTPQPQKNVDVPGLKDFIATTVQSKKDQALLYNTKYEGKIINQNYIKPRYPLFQRGALCGKYNDIVLINIHLTSGGDWWDAIRKKQLIHFFSKTLFLLSPIILIFCSVPDFLTKILP